MNTIPSRAPTMLRSIAVAGVLVAIIGTVVIWVFLSDLEDTTDRSLLIGQQATVALNDTLDVAEQVLNAVDDGLTTVQSTLSTIDDVLQSTAGLADATGSLAATLPASFDDIDTALATVQRLGETVDSTLTALSALPFGPDYNPTVPFPQAVGDLRDALAPIGDELTTISTELENFANGSGDLTAEIDSLTSDVEQTRTALAGTDDLLAKYRTAATDAGQLAAETRDQLSGSMTRMRIVLVALGLLLALSQFIPWTLAGLIEDRRVGVVGAGVVDPDPPEAPNSSGVTGVDEAAAVSDSADNLNE